MPISGVRLRAAQRLSTSSRRPAALLAVSALLAAGAVALVTAAAEPAGAAVSPIASRTDSMVTADALPTVQIAGAGTMASPYTDAVAWSQVIVNGTVYVAGSFANAYPAGTSAAAANMTPRANLLAYTLSTGSLKTSFAPSLNAQARVIAASPDGTRIYVGGDFTTANGVTRSRIAAYNTSDGSLISTFAPAIGTTVTAIAATNSTVYVGGQFTQAAGVARNRLAAFNASDGSLTAWNPGADSNVNAMVLTPDGSRLIVGGAFQHVGGQPEYGLAAVDATSGAVEPWAANQSVQDAGTNAAIESLRTDGTAIYGTGYNYGTDLGNLEGAFSADPDTGNLNWVESCHGDTYDSYPSSSAGVVYVVGHSHYCGDLGGFPQTDTPWVLHHSLAFTTNATGTLQHDHFGSHYKDWYGTASPSLVGDWLPDFYTGTATGQGQAAWTVTGTSQYVVEGGEFPGVNGAAQQGLVRFAVPSLATNKQGPRVNGAGLAPNLSARSTSSVRVAFESDWDRDDNSLTYNVYRNGATTPVYTTTASSLYWQRPMLGFTDTGLTPGATYSYQVNATDPDGNIAHGSSVSITVPTANPPSYPYASQMASDGASLYWPMDEASGAALDDHINYNDGLVAGTVTRGVAGPVSGVPATQFNGSTGYGYQQQTPAYGPTTFSIEGWFKTTSTSGGEIIGYGSAQTALSQTNDRAVYLDNAGHLNFDLQTTALTTSASYNHGTWHQVVATLSGSTAVIYVDGVAVVSSSSAPTPQSLFAGNWRVGGDNLSTLPNAPTSNYLAGSIGQVSVFPTALSASKVSQHYSLRTGTARIQPAIAKISPTSGPAAGGTSVTLTGTGFTGASAVKFGSVAAASFTVNSDTSITAVSPAEPAGWHDVVVTGSGGTSATSTADHFTFK